MIRWRTLSRDELLAAIKSWLGETAPLDRMQITVELKPGETITLNSVPQIDVGFTDHGEPQADRATVDLGIPKNAQTRAICVSLQHVVDGHRANGWAMGLFEDAIDKLKEQDAELARHRSDRAYIIGHNDGWNAAFATGLTADTEEEPPMAELDPDRLAASRMAGPRSMAARSPAGSRTTTSA